MCKFIGKCNERILCKLNKSEILRLYSIVHVAMETTKTSNFTCQSESFISIFFTCQVSACELQPFSCHDVANDMRSQTAKTVFSHLKICRNHKTRTYFRFFHSRKMRLLAFWAFLQTEMTDFPTLPGFPHTCIPGTPFGQGLSYRQ